MNVLKQIQRALNRVIEIYFNSDLDVMSSEAKEILSNPEDRRKYIEAVDRLKKNHGLEETITLSNKREITLVS